MAPSPAFGALDGVIDYFLSRAKSTHGSFLVMCFRGACSMVLNLFRYCGHTHVSTEDFSSGWYALVALCSDSRPVTAWRCYDETWSRETSRRFPCAAPPRCFLAFFSCLFFLPFFLPFFCSPCRHLGVCFAGVRSLWVPRRYLVSAAAEANAMCTLCAKVPAVGTYVSSSPQVCTGACLPACAISKYTDAGRVRSKR